MVSQGGTRAGGDRRRRVFVKVITDSGWCNKYTVPTTSGPQGWADLSDDLLHSIIAMLGSFGDLLAFAATSTSWRAAFSSNSSKSTLWPPLLLQPGVPMRSSRPHPLSDSLIPKRPCYCTDLADQDKRMCCQIPRVIDADSFCFIGASCGHIFLACKQTCLVVDIFTGVSVSPPQVPNEGYTHQPYYADLTAPLASPNSHLLVITVRQCFFWRVGSQSWLRCSNIGTPKQVVVFKGQVFVMDRDRKLVLVHFVPEIYVQEIAIDWGKEGMTGTYEWLVECDDMLIMVSFQCSLSVRNTFKAFRLDLSTKPAKWVEVEKLENWAIFISIDIRIRPLCCINPERWGGRSNSVYYCSRDSEAWVAFELGKPLQRDVSDRSISIYSSMWIEPMWIVPNIFTYSN